MAAERGAKVKAKPRAGKIVPQSLVRGRGWGWGGALFNSGKMEIKSDMKGGWENTQGRGWRLARHVFRDVISWVLGCTFFLG